MLTPQNWKDYELLDAGEGEKLERWDKYILRRPDPEAIWSKALEEDTWTKADAIYRRSGVGGKWLSNKLPEQWEIGWENLRFLVRLTDFKHIGLFPEQAVHWSWLYGLLEKSGSCKSRLNVLNLFGYTGGSTVACAKAGAKVTHVDASKGIVSWAKENLVINDLADAPVRLIVDDVFKFLAREEKRGVRYDGIIMDPPVYGRGTEGEAWKLNKMLTPLVRQCIRLLSPNPLFFIINSYVAGVSPVALKNILLKEAKKPLFPEAELLQINELGLPITAGGLILPAGVFARWSK